MPGLPAYSVQELNVYAVTVLSHNNATDDMTSYAILTLRFRTLICLILRLSNRGRSMRILVQCQIQCRSKQQSSN